MPRTACAVLFAAIAAAMFGALAGAEAFGGLPLGGTAPALHAPAGLNASAPALPQTATPSVPSVPTSSVPSLSSLPSLPGAGSVAGSAGAMTHRVAGAGATLRGASAAGSSLAGSSAAQPSPASNAAGAVTAGGGNSTAVAANNGGGGPATSGNGGAGSTTAQHVTVAREYRGPAGERRLRHDVRRFSPCLGTLPALEHRMLALRAGIGSAPLSRGQAAARLHVSRGHAVALEERGIEDLKSAARAGGCAAESGPATLGARAALISSQLASVPQFQAPLLLAARPSLVTPVALAPGAAPRSGVEAASASGGSDTLASGSTQIAGTQPSTADPLYFLVLALAALSVAGVALLRGRRHAGRARRVAELEHGIGTGGAGVSRPTPSAAMVKRGREVVGPPPTSQPDQGSESASAGRTAAAVTASIMSVAIAELVRRRRR